MSGNDGPASADGLFKGCPLRCRWCHNPEGLSFETRNQRIRATLPELRLCRSRAAQRLPPSPLPAYLPPGSF
jgi:pyruvate-formate lyase-activating enzyme